MCAKKDGREHIYGAAYEWKFIVFDDNKKIDKNHFSILVSHYCVQVYSVLS